MLFMATTVISLNGYPPLTNCILRENQEAIPIIIHRQNAIIRRWNEKQITVCAKLFPLRQPQHSFSPYLDHSSACLFQKAGIQFVLVALSFLPAILVQGGYSLLF